MNELVRQEQAKTNHTIPPSGRIVTSKQQGHDERVETGAIQQHPLTASPDLNFPGRLFIMLEQASAEGFDNVVSWLPNSDTILKVYKPATFESMVLPRFFPTSKYASFTRQLHAYDFKWIHEGDAKGGYYNPKFSKSNPSGCFSLERKRKKSKSNHSARILDPVISPTPRWESLSSSLSSTFSTTLNFPAGGTLVPPHHQGFGSIRSTEDATTDESPLLHCRGSMAPSSMVATSKMNNSTMNHTSRCRHAKTTPMESFLATCNTGTPQQDVAANLVFATDGSRQHEEDDMSNSSDMLEHLSFDGVGVMSAATTKQKEYDDHTSSTSTAAAPVESKSGLRPRPIEEMIQDPISCYQGIRSFNLLTSPRTRRGGGTTTETH